MKRMVAIACAAVVCTVLMALYGCAYLNGDAMGLGETQKGVSVSNTLMTLRDTEYDFKEGNLPFTFTCEPSGTPYLFGARLQSNSVFKVRFVWGDSPKDRDEVVEIRNGVAHIHKCDGSGWFRPGGEEAGTEISHCSFASFILHHGNEWLFYAGTTNENYHARGKLAPCKAAIDRRFVIEECQNVIFEHKSNWYDW